MRSVSLRREKPRRFADMLHFDVVLLSIFKLVACLCQTQSRHDLNPENGQQYFHMNIAVRQLGQIMFGEITYN